MGNATNRERVTNSQFPTTRQSFQAIDGVWTANALIQTGSVVGTKHVTRDVKTPNFAKRIKSGEIILNNFDSALYTRDYTGMTLAYSVPRDGYQCYYQGDLAAMVEAKVLPIYGVLNDLTRMKDVAIVSAYAKINDGIQTGEILAELGKTIEGLKRPFGNVYDILENLEKRARKRYVRNRRLKTIVAYSQAFASAWLELRYAMVPLLLDCRSAVKKVQTARERLGVKRLVSRAHESGSSLRTKTFSKEQLATNFWFASGSVTSRESATVDAGVIYTVDLATVQHLLLADARLNASDLASTIWEIAPYSLVLDWFVNVGDWLNAQYLPPGISIQGNWVTTVYNGEVSYAGTDLEHRGYRADSAYVHGNWGSSTQTWVSINRFTGYPVPSTPSRVMNYQRVIHALDGAALALNPIIKVLRSKGLAI